MGLRGFQTQPDSKRGRVENGGIIPEPVQEALECPAWLKGSARKEFSKLVELNRAAGVAIRQIDADLYAELADLVLVRRETSDVRDKLAIGRQIDELRSALNIGPRNRQRAGIKDSKKPAGMSKTLSLIELSKRAGN